MAAPHIKWGVARSRVYEITDVGHDIWELAFEKLATVPGIDKEFDRAPQGMNAAGETARFPNKPSQVMAQFSIIGLNGVGLAFVGQGAVRTRRVDERVVGGKSIGEVLLSKRTAIQHGLERRCGALPSHIPADNAVRRAVNVGQDVDFVFLSPMKVNNSSNSFTSNVMSGGSGGWLGRLLAYAFSQLATV